MSDETGAMRRSRSGGHGMIDELTRLLAAKKEARALMVSLRPLTYNSPHDSTAYLNAVCAYLDASTALHAFLTDDTVEALGNGNERASLLADALETLLARLRDFLHGESTHTRARLGMATTYADRIMQGCGHEQAEAEMTRCWTDMSGDGLVEWWRVENARPAAIQSLCGVPTTEGETDERA